MFSKITYTNIIGAVIGSGNQIGLRFEIKCPKCLIIAAN